MRFECKDCGSVRSTRKGVSPKVCAACGGQYFKAIPERRGRPLGLHYTPHTPVRLTPEQLTYVTTHAALNKTSKAAIVRQIIQREIDSQ
jgi:predicted  nucleic acid-binding Zn-ribbon protein